MSEDLGRDVGFFLRNFTSHTMVGGEGLGKALYSWEDMGSLFCDGEGGVSTCGIGNG